jgi:hypothetical protein
MQRGDDFAWRVGSGPKTPLVAGLSRVVSFSGARFC